MNHSLFHKTQTKRQYVFTIVGAGSLRTLTARAVGGLTTDDIKPALVNQQQISNLENTRIVLDTRAGFKFVSNHFVNRLNIQQVNEPAPTQINGGVL